MWRYCDEIQFPGGGYSAPREQMSSQYKSMIGSSLMLKKHLERHLVQTRVTREGHPEAALKQKRAYDLRH